MAMRYMVPLSLIKRLTEMNDTEFQAVLDGIQRNLAMIRTRLALSPIVREFVREYGADVVGNVLAEILAGEKA
jgi:hypothetical protein